MQTTNERRSRRSPQLDEALTYLLSAQRERGALHSITISDDAGLLLAAEGHRPTCEELAALAPMIARGVRVGVDEQLLGAVTVNAFRVEGREYYLTLFGGEDLAAHPSLSLAGMQGATRILRS